MSNEIFLLIDVTLDPDTAYQGLILSADGKQMRYEDYNDLHLSLEEAPQVVGMCVDYEADSMHKRTTGPHGVNGQGGANSHGNQGATMYAEEKNEVCCPSDLDVHVKVRFEDLWHQKDHLLKKNANLKQSLNTCENANSELDNENTAIKKQIKSMEHLVKGMSQMRAEMDSIRAALSEKEMTNCGLKVWISKLQKENEALKDHLETSTNEKSDNLLAKEMDKRQIKNLTLNVLGLQQEVELTRMKIAEKDEIMLNKDFVIDQKKASIDEMISIGQDLKKKAKDLKRQLELALEHGAASGQESSMASDGHHTGATRNHLPLAQEFSLSGLQEPFDEEVKATETVSRQKETTDLTEDVVKELKEEGDVIIQRVAAHDLTEVSASGNSTHWLNKAWTSCKRGALLGVSFGLGTMLPFCLLGVAMTSCSNLTSTDALQEAILQHGTFLPPF